MISGIKYFAQICDCSLDAELIDRNNCAKNQFNGFFTSVVVNGLLSTHFAFQFSCFWSAGGPKCRMPAQSCPHLAKPHLANFGVLSSCSPQLYSFTILACWRESRTTSSHNQVQDLNNIRMETSWHVLHSAIMFWISARIPNVMNESWEYCPFEFHRFSIMSIQFFEIACFQIPLKFLLLGLNWFSTYASQTWHRVRKDVGFGFHDANNSITQQRRFSPHGLVPINRGRTCNLRLIFDQLLSWPIKLLHRLRRLILDRPWVLYIVSSKMNCSLKCGRHEYTPYGCVHIEILQIICRTSTTSLSHDREDFLHVKRTIWWYMEMMWPNSAFGFWVFWSSWSSWVSWISFVSWCCKSPCAYEQLSIHLPSLRTRRCVGIGWNFDLRLHQVSLDAIGHRWRICRNRTGQVHRRRPEFRHHLVFFFLFLHPFSPSF